MSYFFINILKIAMSAIGALSSFIRHQRQRCAGAGVQESTPAGFGVLQQEPEQDQE